MLLVNASYNSSLTVHIYLFKFIIILSMLQFTSPSLFIMLLQTYTRDNGFNVKHLETKRYNVQQRTITWRLTQFHFYYFTFHTESRAIKIIIISNATREHNYICKPSPRTFKITIVKMSYRLFFFTYLLNKLGKSLILHFSIISCSREIQ